PQKISRETEIYVPLGEQISYPDVTIYGWTRSAMIEIFPCRHLLICIIIARTMYLKGLAHADRFLDSLVPGMQL
ncbi:MAG: hypothetical protein KDA87_16570, partial [Planctomycetales bacterium]|nr:hypothetical protein [Planctomycetales bacterium]